MVTTTIIVECEVDIPYSKKELDAASDFEIERVVKEALKNQVDDTIGEILGDYERILLVRIPDNFL